MPTRIVAVGSQKSPFEEWAQMTGWHGILDFVYAKSIVLKAVWALLLIIACFFAVNQVYALLRDYLKEDQWITTITYMTPEKVLDWPRFTLCNLNWLSKKKLIDANLANQPYAVQYAAKQEEGVKFYEQMLDSDTIRDVDNFTFYMNDTPATLKQKMQSLAMSCKDTMITCGASQKFNLANDSRRDCCVNSTPSAIHMSCFKINPNLNFKQNRTKYAASGYKAGIYFLLNNAPSDDYENVLYLEKPSAGFKITLYYGDDDTDPLNPTILTGPGKHSVISVSMQKTRTISRRRNRKGIQLDLHELPCHSTDEVEYEFIDASIYSKSLCESDCHIHYMMDECECTNSLLTLKNGSACTGKDVKCATDDIFNQLNNSSIRLSKLGFNLTECKSKCSDSCEFDTVSASVSSTSFPAPLKIDSLVSYINQALLRNETADTVSEFTLLEFFYENDQYKLMEKTERLPIDELISSIGGTLGVWTGISIISIFQAVMYCLMGVNAVVQKLMTMNRKDDVQMITVK